ncbi:MAG: zinc metalloprotease [Bacteroidetes bacterium HGW-Bacteroidetes-18]|nr:MAG: zinc metalloprotease [Bacteroidetes bacterium HGW-Bacteroidetes-18]
MKKLFLSLAILALAIVACQNNDEVTPNQEAAVDMSDFYVYTSDDVSSKSTKDAPADKCASMKVLNQQLRDNPGLENRMFQIEKHTREFIAAKSSAIGKGKPGSGGGGTTLTPYSGTVTIPVYIHVIYSNSAQNISETQIYSQIAVLNNDFNDSNYSDVPTEFQNVGANIDINFTLNSGNITRHSDATTSWGTNNSVKTKYPPVAGYLNFWVCNIGGGILGYAQFPGGNAATDGVVVGTEYFGSILLDPDGYYGNPTTTYFDSYNKGRTATHEVGHWLNLRHIWGDGRCKQDDFVADTPSSDRANYGCPAPVVHCQSTDMTMNYMDYTDDACMNLFTLGQKDRMRAIFASGGSRESFVQVP